MSAADSLVALGFTALEADVYISLVGSRPITGYRVAQAIGKPVPNTYKAIESLARRGAVLIEDGDSRLVRAAPPDDVLGHLERSARASRERAADQLSRIERPDADERIYQIHSVDEVFERARRMLAGARHVVLADVFPGALAHIIAELTVAARKLAVAVEVYAPARIPRAEVVVHPRGDHAMASWPGQWLNLVVDSSETLLAFLRSDLTGVHQAVWTQSAYLSCLYHSGVWNQIAVASLEHKLHRDSSLGDLRTTLARMVRRFAPEATGIETLRRRFGLEAPAARPARRAARHGPPRRAGSRTSSPAARAGVHRAPRRGAP